MQITIQKGDTLWSLAAKHLGNPLLWPRLWEGNREAIEREQRRQMRRDLRGPDWIVPGTVLTVPEQRTQEPQT